MNFASVADAKLVRRVVGKMLSGSTIMLMFEKILRIVVITVHNLGVLIRRGVTNQGMMMVGFVKIGVVTDGIIRISPIL